MASEVGCQLPWNMGTVEGMPLCDNSAEFIRYDNYVNAIFFMAYSQLVKTVAFCHALLRNIK